MSTENGGRAAAAHEQARRTDPGRELVDGGAHPMTTPTMAEMDEKRGHALVPASASSWPALYATEDVPTEDKIIRARYFGCGGQEWLVAEMDQETGEVFGWADLGVPEWGYSSLEEMGTAWNPGLPGRFPAIERDLDFKPTRFGDLAAARRDR